MRACVVAYTFYENDTRVRRYAEALVRRGDEVDAIALRQEGQPQSEIIRGVRVLRIQKRVIDETGPLSYLRRLLTFFFRSMWVLTWRHLRVHYDVIHVHSVPDFQVFAALVPRLMGARVILDIHDIVPEFYASKFKIGERSLTFRLLMLVERLSIAFSNHVIIANHLWWAKLTKRSVRPEKCTAIINYPDTSIFYPRPRSVGNNGHFVMCYPGTLGWHQGLDLAITAMAQLRDKAPNLELLIIGDGPERAKLQTMVRQHRLEGRVMMNGILPVEKVAETMANVDLGIVPKRADSFGNEAFSTKIPEFMAMRVPVIAANTRIDQFYFKEDMVQFFEAGDVDDLCAKVLDLVRNPTRRDALREHASAFVRENNWDLRKAEYLDLVDRLVKRGAPAGIVDSPVSDDRCSG